MEETEITGPLAAGLRISSSTSDADLFLIFRVFTADMREVVFAGAIDPHTPVAQGWLRASHRKVDDELSKPWRPYHMHDERQPLTPGEPVDLLIEIWPTCIVVPARMPNRIVGARTGLRMAESNRARLSNFKNELTGCGPFLHDDPRDRPRRSLAAAPPCISTTTRPTIFFFRSFHGSEATQTVTKCKSNAQKSNAREEP